MLVRTVLVASAIALVTSAPAAFADDLDIAFEDLAAESALGIADFEAQGELTGQERRQLRALRKVVKLVGKPRNSLRREGKIAVKLATVLARSGLAELDGDSEYSSLLDDILLEYDDAIYEALDRADTAAFRNRSPLRREPGSRSFGHRSIKMLWASGRTRICGRWSRAFWPGSRSWSVAKRSICAASTSSSRV